MCGWLNKVGFFLNVGEISRSDTIADPMKKVRCWKINVMFFYAEALQPRDVTAPT